MKNVIVGINSKYIHPAFGAHQLKANSSGNVDLIEINIKDDINSLVSKLETYDVIHFSAYIWNINIIKEILKNHLKDKTIAIGGPEASYSFESLFKYPQVKYIVKGEGEETFQELLDYFNGLKKIDEVSNLYYLKDGLIHYTYTKLPDLNKIKHDYSINQDLKNKICYVESSRGCYFSCTYCLASTEKPVREFPIEEVKKNLKYLLDNNAKIIKFLDRSFNINQERTLDLLKFIKENDNGFTTFQFEVVGDRLSDEIIDLLNKTRKKSIRFEIGIQSTNPQTTKAIKRIQDFDKIKQNILRIKDNIVIHTDLICGLPYEDLESFKKSFNDTFMLFTEELQLGFLKELKGTEISDTKNLYGYTFENNAPYEVLSNNFISKDELDEVKIVEKAVDKLYNYSKYQKTFSYLFNDLKLSPYDTLLKVSKYIEAHSTFKAQPHVLAKEFYEALSELVSDKDELLYRIKIDYLTKSALKPTIWWEQTITRGERLYVYKAMSKKHQLNIDTLYNYARLEKNKNDFFLIIYPSHDTYYFTSTLAPCGFDCKFCPMFDRGCKGCTSTELFSFCQSCTIRNCAKEKNIAICSSCTKYPCSNLDKISNESKRLLDSLRK